MTTQKPHVTVRAGRLQFHKLNTSAWDWRDVYHWLLTLSWPQFASLVLAVYLSINLFFALLYFMRPESIAGMPSRSFPDAFFFSVETLATVGYGHFYPNSIYGHTVATLEIMSGMFGLAVITGLIFVRFSRPSARLEFSRVLVVAPFKGKPALMFRVANLRQHAMAEAEFRIMVIRHENTEEEDHARIFHALPLQLDRVILFPAALTIRHVIDEKSPLHGVTAEHMQRDDYRFMVSVICIDTVIPAAVQSQYSYTWRDVRHGERFVEIYNELDNDIMEVDYGRISDTEPVGPRT